MAGRANGKRSGKIEGTIEEGRAEAMGTIWNRGGVTFMMCRALHISQPHISASADCLDSIRNAAKAAI
jgi:hypothetical protein